MLKYLFILILLLGLSTNAEKSIKYNMNHYTFFYPDNFSYTENGISQIPDIQKTIELFQLRINFGISIKEESDTLIITYSLYDEKTYNTISNLNPEFQEATIQGIQTTYIQLNQLLILGYYIGLKNQKDTALAIDKAKKLDNGQYKFRFRFMDNTKTKVLYEWDYNQTENQ